MKILWMIVIAAVAWFIGIVGWAQIIGSIQHASERGRKATMSTIIVWVVIFGVLTAAVYFFLRKYFIAYLIGLGISMIRILFAGRVS